MKRLTQEDKENAAKAKSKYESSSDEGLKRIRNIIKDEENFVALLKWVRDTKIGLRRGTEAKNAAYALSDFASTDDTQDKIDEIYWQVQPYTKSTEKTNKWYEHLYNSILIILGLEGSSSASLLLSTGAGAGTNAERYSVSKLGDVKLGIGDGESFTKVNLISDGQKVGESLSLDLSTAFEDYRSTVDKVLQWIYDTFEKKRVVNLTKFK